MTETRKIEKLEVKLSPAEKEQIRADAERMKQNLSDYARSLLLRERAEDQKASLERDLRERPQESPARAEEIHERSVPHDLNPPRQTEADEVEAFKESPEDEFTRRVNRHALRMPRRKAEAIVKKEMGLDG